MKNSIQRFFIFLIALGFSAPVWADETENLIRQEGKVVSIRISKGHPVRIFVLGREEAKLDLTKLTLTVRRLKPYPGKILKLDRHGDYFQVQDASDFERSSELEISTSVQGKTESFNLKLDKKP